MQRWADAKVFAFVNLRSTDAKAFCQSSACVPEILLRLASVRMGEWVNTVGRTIRFLVAKALNFKIRENSRLRRVFRVCVICVFLRTVVSSPIGQQNALTSDAQKTQKTRRRRGCERRHADADAKDATQTRPPSPAYFALPNSVSNLSLPCSHS